jgi:tetratricopeptide (TPR) repeat protein
MRLLLRFAAVVLAVWFIALEVRAAEEGRVLRMRAEQLAAAGQCEDAIAKAQAARKLAPDDALAAAVEGRCALNLRRYEDAAVALEAARQLDPGLPGVSLDLTVAYYHVDDFEAANAALARAESESPDDPRVALYRGLLLMEASEDASAAAAFERASRMDSGIDPMASYYAALAWERANDQERARRSLERVRESGSPWSDEAEDALQRLNEREGAATPRWWGVVSAGAEYDSNVVLRGDGVVLPADISDQEDGRVIWSAELGTELLRTENYAGGAIAGYHGNSHFDLHEYDLQYPTASLWLDRRIDELSFVRLQPYGGYAWIDGDPYVGQGGGTLSYHRDYPEYGSGRAFVQASYQDYLFKTGLVPPGVDPNDLDRDGWEFLTGYDHAYALTDKTGLRGGLAFGSYRSEGRDYTYLSYGAHVGLRQNLPYEFILDLEAAYAYQPYQHASSYNPIPRQGPKRRDNIYSTRVALERSLTDWLSVTAQWRYYDSDSNTRVFDYDRHIVGGYFTAFYGR